MTSWIGPRGISVLIFFGLVALALAIVGWLDRSGAVLAPLPNYSSQTVVHLIVGGIAR